MDIKHLRYVVAIANTGTFREASEQLFVSQPNLSISIKDLEQELGFLVFERTNSGAVLTPQGERFYEQAQTILRNFESFESRYTKNDEVAKTFSVASQHYDFLAPVGVDFTNKNPEVKNFRVFESTTFNILQEVADGHSEVGIAYLNKYNRAGIMRMLDKLELEEIELMNFKTHIYVRNDHPLTKKDKIYTEDLKSLSRARFTQESDQYLYYSEDLVETFEDTLIYNVTDRATLNGILERTDSYATGSGFIDGKSVHNIAVLSIEDGNENALILFKKKSHDLSKFAQSYRASLEDYFEKNKF
ncbi:LysR family transcriptional regulator [Floricoccus tropicus]|uniref:LysR family transcriptional regulator n=2 Tax=Floricoccus TaxID=1930830 RepID=A0A1E8GN06_9LACT|nr:MULTISPECIES: LysR family transcriptional regulator [Floricoccus]OFI45788.1 LysR family transcriptional regulator [Floricoccus penangensis]OFI49629.1 LysR family transcriptional regulator [Floricoccus tropicus]URZ88033.1 LysR family transcriptional regulator [Floricoccus penangensis]